MARQRVMETHDFYCLNCGNKNMPLARKRSHLHEKNHRKRLYCYHCKKEVNHIEVRNYEEQQDFLERFKNGEFIEEAKESIESCEGSSMWVLFESVSSKR